MTPDLSRSLAGASERLRLGQSDEASGEFSAAVSRYDDAIALLRALPSDADETRRAFGVALMNRGNALQKIAAAGSHERERLDSTAAAVASYDEAIALFRTLPFATTPAYRNHLGAAWLNRGHALLAVNDSASAADSFDQAISILRSLPLDENSAYRLNLAGAWTNLAHALLCAPLHAFPRSHSSAQAALDLLARTERTHLAFAEMSLRARRALATAIGELLVIADHARQPTTALATAAGDALDDGLALAREWESRGGTSLRPLALRLFRLGAQLYRVHQPQFLAEFLLENLAPGAFAGDAGFRAAADDALELALAAIHRPQLLVAGSPGAEKLLRIAHSLRSAQARLSELNALPPSAPA